MKGLPGFEFNFKVMMNELGDVYNLWGVLA
jgi:hypothetical protein